MSIQFSRDVIKGWTTVPSSCTIVIGSRLKRERLFVVLARLLLLDAALVAEDLVAMPTLVGMLTALGESSIILICGTLSQFVLHQHKLRTSMEILLLKQVYEGTTELR